MKRLLLAVVLLCGCAPAPIDETPFLGQWRYPATTETEVPPNCAYRNSCRGYVIGLGRDRTYTVTSTEKNEAGCITAIVTVRGQWHSEYADGVPHAVLTYPLDCYDVTRGPCYSQDHGACGYMLYSRFRATSTQLIDVGGGTDRLRLTRVQ